MRVVYSGKWSVFNDPTFDQRMIPEDEKEKEALRLGLLLTDWISIKNGALIGIAGKLNVDKLVTYYYTKHANHSAPLHICLPIQYHGLSLFPLCLDYTEEEIKRHDSMGTFQYIWQNERVEFIPNIIILPFVFLTGNFSVLHFSKLFVFKSILILDTSMIIE